MKINRLSNKIVNNNIFIISPSIFSSELNTFIILFILPFNPEYNVAYLNLGFNLVLLFENGSNLVYPSIFII